MYPNYCNNEANFAAKGIDFVDDDNNNDNKRRHQREATSAETGQKSTSASERSSQSYPQAREATQEAHKRSSKYVLCGYSRPSEIDTQEVTSRYATYKAIFLSGIAVEVTVMGTFPGLMFN